jgi:hypothetical protein
MLRQLRAAPFLALLPLLAGACAAAGQVDSQSTCSLYAASLTDRYESLEAARAALGKIDGAAYAWGPTTTTATAVPGAEAAVVRVEETRPTDPRTVGSGAFHLAVSAHGGWFVAPSPLDVINGGAGHLFVPQIVPGTAELVSHAGTPRTLLRLARITSVFCDVCEDAERSVPTEFRLDELVVACTLATDTPACTEPVTVDIRATISLRQDDVLRVSSQPVCQMAFPPG